MLSFFLSRLRRFFAYALATAALFLVDPHAYTLRLDVWKHAPHQLLVGYFPQWGLYYDHPYYVKNLVTNGGAGLIGQLNYAQGFVTGGRCSVADPNADLNTTYTRANSVSGVADNPASPFRGYFHQLKELKRRYPHLKILISLEGNPADFAKDARPENRRAFVASCVETFLRGHFARGVNEPGIFDGFDIDWEYPREEDAANFRALLAEFRRQMKAVHSGLRLTVAVGQSPHMLPGTDFAAIAALVDQVGVMNYDYNGPWSDTTGLLAPLFANPADPHHSGTIEHSISSYEAAGVPADKLLMGLPFYGYSWTGVGRTDNGLFQTGRGVHTDEPYHYIRTLAPPFAEYRDKLSQAPWLFDGETFWTYEDAVSVRYKVSYAAHEHLAGVMVWELSGDTDDAELLGTAYQSLLHPIEISDFESAAAVPSLLDSARRDH
jgi:chitinase